MIGRRLAHEAKQGVVMAYTPILTAVTTDPTLGTGSSSIGYYSLVGTTVTAWATIEFGTSSAAGSGELRFSLPLPATAPYGADGFPVGVATVFTSGTGVFTIYQLFAAGNDTSNCRLLLDGATGFASGSIIGDANRLSIAATYPTTA